MASFASPSNSASAVSSPGGGDDTPSSQPPTTVPSSDVPPGSTTAPAVLAPALGFTPLPLSPTTFPSSRIPAGATVIPPGATVVSGTSPSGGPILNPRSCVTCRRRKVRCDKRMPCSNCRRASIACIFPAPGRAPRRPRAPRDPASLPPGGGAGAASPAEGGKGGAPGAGKSREIELLKRLRKLEGIVEELSGQVELEANNGRHSSSSWESPGPGGSGGTGTGDAAMLDVGAGAAAITQKAGGVTSGSSPASADAGGTGWGRLVQGYNTSYGPLARSRSQDHEESPSEVNRQFGRLVLNESGRTRYVSSVFWSKVNDELDQLRAETEMLTDNDSDDESDDEDSPSTDRYDQPVTDHHSFLFGYRSADVDLRQLHPLASQIPFIWQVYQESVDPLVKILHKPSMEKLIRDMRISYDALTPGTEALMFSIYYAAITSMEDDEVKRNFGVEKSELLSRYRFALEQGLAKANFLNSSELVVLQAFVLFLFLVRRHDDTRFAWTLTGLAIRIAQSLGIQRDGTHFNNLSIFEIEMRRRLWWAIGLLDFRSAEDQGTDLTIADKAFDTRVPLNINDTDIDPDSKLWPEEREGATDLTFSLIRYEICNLARRFHANTTAIGNEAVSVEEREKMLVEVYHRVETKYLKEPTTEMSPMFWVMATIARLIMSKMTLLLYQPVLFAGPSDDVAVSSEIRDRLLMSAIEICEYNRVLNTEPKCKQWRWLFQTYTQWHAIAYMLMEISRRPWTATAERAWSALNDTFSNPTPQDLARMAEHSTVWLPLRQLFAKARRHRAAEITRLRADPNSAHRLEIEERLRVPQASFGTLPTASNYITAHERWRNLVGTKGPPLEMPSRAATFPQRQQQTQEGGSMLQMLTSQPNQNPRPQKSVFSGGTTLGPMPASSSSSSGDASGAVQPRASAGVASPGLGDETGIVNDAFNFMTSVLSQSSSFDPTQLFPIAFNVDMIDRVGRPALTAPPGPQVKIEPGAALAGSSSSSIEASTPSGSGSSSSVPPVSTASLPQQQPLSAMPASSTSTSPPPAANVADPQRSNSALSPGSFLDNNPPPWLWSDGFGSSARYPSVDAVAIADTDSNNATAGLPEGLVDDVDMGSMDLDDFNWQNWHASVANFEMETGLSTAQRGAWGAPRGL